MQALSSNRFRLNLHLQVPSANSQFANSLDPDQARQNVGPDLDANCLTLMVFLKDFFENVNFEEKENQQTTAHTISEHAMSSQAD